MFLTALLLQGATALTPALVPADPNPDERLRTAISELQEESTSEWTRTADVGITEESGNTNTLNSFANLLLDWKEADVQNWDLKGQYRATREQDETTGTNFSDRRLMVVSSSYRHIFSTESNFFGYGKTARREDKPNDLIRRFDAGAGAGYQFDLYEGAVARLELGASWVSDIKTGVEEVETIAARFSYYLDTPLAENVSLLNEGESLEGDTLRTYTHRTSFKWIFNRFEGANVFLQATYEVFFDGNPIPGDTSTDRILFITLGSEF
jgi:putative salt-induced outer membrane protein YdiY